jgi:hypothetical protein
MYVSFDKPKFRIDETIQHSANAVYRHKTKWRKWSVGEVHIHIEQMWFEEGIEEPMSFNIQGKRRTYELKNETTNCF